MLRKYEISTPSSSPSQERGERVGVFGNFAENQQGQSLIETIVAIFVLTTGLVSGLALAIYSFGASSDILERITATGLAREGVEVVRRMRDSNWLADTLSDCENGQKCYEDWLDETYDITKTSGQGRVIRLFFDPLTASAAKWSVSTSGPTDDYRLYVQPTRAFSHTASSEPTNFFRKITIFYDDLSAPYSVTSPLVRVHVDVWWHGKNCAPITYLNSPSDTACKIVTEEYLTNWKNY